MDDFLKRFGLKVKELRKLCGFSQEKFAEMIDVSPTTVTAIETGKNFVTYKTLRNICSALNVSPSDLFNFDIKIADENKLLHQITVRAKALSAAQQKQVIEILKTFE